MALIGPDVTRVGAGSGCPAGTAEHEWWTSEELPGESVTKHSRQSPQVFSTQRHGSRLSAAQSGAFEQSTSGTSSCPADQTHG